MKSARCAHCSSYSAALSADVGSVIRGDLLEVLVEGRDHRRALPGAHERDLLDELDGDLGLVLGADVSAELGEDLGERLIGELTILHDLESEGAATLLMDLEESDRVFVVLEEVREERSGQ